MIEKFSPFKFIQAAFEFEFKLRDQSRHENDDYPLNGFEKFQYIVSTLLSKEETRLLIQTYSSYNYGAHILNSVFPKSENPEDYHSRDGVVFITEHPVQVLGWDDEKRLIKEGIEQGLNEDYIRMGFELQAEERGIDLEWSFQEHVPGINNSNKLVSEQ